MMKSSTPITDRSDAMPLTVTRGEKVKPRKRKLRVLLNTNGRLLMSCNSRLFKSHLVVRGDCGPCCKVEFN